MAVINGPGVSARAQSLLWAATPARKYRNTPSPPGAGYTFSPPEQCTRQSTRQAEAVQEKKRSVDCVFTSMESSLALGLRLRRRVGLVQTFLYNGWFTYFPFQNLRGHEVQELRRSLGNKSFEEWPIPGVKQILEMQRKIAGDRAQKEHQEIH